MTPFLDHQKNVSHQVPLPVAQMEQSSVVVTVSALPETVQFIVAATNISDAGSSVGTLVYGQVAHDRISDSTGNAIGHHNDTSFVFGTGTALATQVEFPYEKWEYLVNDYGKSRTEKLAEIAQNLTSGQFMLNHRTGLLIGKKATTETSDSATYKYRNTSTSSSGGSSDITSVIPGTGSVYLGKAEDAAHVSGDVGVMSLAVRQDVAGSLVGLDGDYAPLQVDSTGALRVTSTGGGGGGVSHTDNSAFTAGTTAETPAGGFVNTPGANDVTAGNSGSFGMTTTRAMRIQLDTAPAAATSIAKAEDAVAATGDVGVSVLAIRKDTPTNLVSAEGDYASLEVDANGNVHTNLGTLISGEDQTNMVLGTKSKPMASATYTWDVSKSTAYEASRLAKASAGVVRSITGYNSLGSAQFIQLHNAASLPANGVVPDVIITVPASSNFTIDLGENGYYCSTGIVACNSSTGATKTIGAADCWFTVSFK